MDRSYSGDKEGKTTWAPREVWPEWVKNSKSGCLVSVSHCCETKNHSPSVTSTRSFCLWGSMCVHSGRDPGRRGNSYSGKSSSVVNNGKKITENLRQIELQKKAGLDPLDLTGLFKMFSLSLKNNRICWSYVAWWRIMIRFESWSDPLAAVDGTRARNGRNSTCPGAVDSTCVRMCVSVCVYALTFTHPVLPQRMWPPRISFRSSEEQLICTSTGRKTIL